MADIISAAAPADICGYLLSMFIELRWGVEVSKRFLCCLSCDRNFIMPITVENHRKLQQVQYYDFIDIIGL